jgi:hypothetical protein
VAVELMTPLPDAFETLISIASADLAPSPSSGTLHHPGVDSHRLRELGLLLSRRNGFYAFESALHVLPAVSSGAAVGLDVWNSEGLWKSSYDRDVVENCLFFGEDVFGVQFCLSGEHVWTFDPETGEKARIADDVPQWAESVLRDYEVLAGCSVARDWQALHGPLDPGKRLIPTVSFALGGECSIDNLHALDAAQGMRLRGDVAAQIRDLPDGTRVRYDTTD